jgi:ubiquinone/menaquinone biosynthesis C-methylase UbiE
MPAGTTASAEEIKDVNVRYHDAAASAYDRKWGIDFGQVGQDQVEAKLVKALGSPPRRPFGRALEIGAGTGYFSLNLVQRGLIEELTCTDISQGMLDVLAATARDLGVEVKTERTEAERLPFEDESFDLVLGHAILHHIPNLDRAFAEFSRVLRPGGAIAFCGEPSRYGDRLAAGPKRAGMAAAPLWRLLMGAPARSTNGTPEPSGDDLEPEVDVHSFTPADLSALAERAGLTDVRVTGEELLASLHGWLVRTLEGSAEPERIPSAWRQFGFRSYLALQRVDAALLEPRLPASLFYNLLLSARKP